MLNQGSLDYLNDHGDSSLTVEFKISYSYLPIKSDKISTEILIYVPPEIELFSDYNIEF